jgi:hypothetical protein
MADIRVLITFDEDMNLVPIDLASLAVRRRVAVLPGEVIRWESPHGDLRINFPQGSPFGAEKEFQGATDLRVVSSDGTFTYQCGVTLSNGRRIGWPNPTSPQSGGEMIIVHAR